MLMTYDLVLNLELFYFNMSSTAKIYRISCRVFALQQFNYYCYYGKLLFIYSIYFKRK